VTALYVSQVVRESLLDPNPSLRVSQIARESVIFPNGQLRVSQIARLTLIQNPSAVTMYCWAQQTNYPSVTAVTPVTISVGS
jgi:hypothetical protein